MRFISFYQELMLHAKVTGSLGSLIANSVLYVIYFILNLLVTYSIICVAKKVPKVYKKYQETISERDQDLYQIFLFGYRLFFPLVLLFATPLPHIPYQTQITELHTSEYTMDQYGTLMMHPDKSKVPVTVDVYYRNRTTNKDIPYEHKYLRVYKITYFLKNKKEIDMYKTEEFDAREAAGENEINWKNVDN